MSVSVSLTDEATEARLAKGRQWRWVVLFVVIVLSIPLMLVFLYDLRATLAFIDGHFGWLFVAMVIWNVAIFGTLLRIRTVTGIRFPDRSEVNILFEEKMASGRGGAHWLTSGNAAGCLWIIVTDEEIWTSSWFPNSCTIEWFNLEHRIAKRDVRLVKRTGFSRFPSKFWITFRTVEGEQTIALMPWKPEAFVQELGVPVQSD